VRFKQQDKDWEMEDLLGRMHGLNIRETTYALLHGQLRRRWPSVADDYPKPELPLAPKPPTTYAYQAPLPVNPTVAPQWLQTPAPTAPTASSAQQDCPDSFF
jgi:hypothetical protein